jgi:hypothetical protein
MIRGLKRSCAYSRPWPLFDAFTEGDDPYGEHDFGAFDLDGTRYFWKIDYYDHDLEHGSDDPSDPEKTRRVLTIMRADKY